MLYTYIIPDLLMAPRSPPCHAVSRPVSYTKDAMSRPVTVCHGSIFFHTPAKLHENRLIAVDWCCWFNLIAKTMEDYRQTQSSIFPRQKFQSQERCRYPLTNGWCFRSSKILDLSPHFHCRYQQSTCPGRWWGPYLTDVYGLDGEEADRPGSIDLKHLSWIMLHAFAWGKDILGMLRCEPASQADQGTSG